MKTRSRNFLRTVGVSFGRSSVSLAAWRGRRVSSFAHKALAEGEDRTAALSELVGQAQAAGSRCVASMPTVRCRIQWVPLAGVRKRDLRVAVARSAFWQSRLGINCEGYCLWWQFVRDSDGSGINALLVAAPRDEVVSCVDSIRTAGLRVGRLGVSCFDYLDRGISLDVSEVSLVMSVGDTCAMVSGSVGVRVNAVRFDEADAGALLSADPGVRDAMVDNLAACVRRCVESDQSAAPLRARLRVVSTRDLRGDWLELLQARLPQLPVEWTDGWAMVGVECPRQCSAGERWQLPGAPAALMHDRRCSFGVMRRPWLPKVDLTVQIIDKAPRQRYLMHVLSAGTALALAVAGYLHWSLDSQRLALQPGSQRYAYLEQLQGHIQGEIQSFQERLSQRILFYSAIQQVSFERKLMPRLLATIGQATPEEVWLDTVHFERPTLLRIAGKSLGDESISRFMQRLRAADGISGVLLESAVAEGGHVASSQAPRYFKDFVVVCQLRFTGGRL